MDASERTLLGKEITYLVLNICTSATHPDVCLCRRQRVGTAERVDDISLMKMAIQLHRFLVVYSHEQIRVSFSGL
jgi:hypothetical protein